MTSVAIALALGCALLTNVAFLCKHRGAGAAPDVSFSRPLQSAIGLFRCRWWTIGFAIAAVAWGLHVAALTIAPLSLVQVVTAGGLVLLALPAERWFGIRLGRREWIGLTLSTAGLVLLAATVQSAGAHEHSSYSVATMLAFEGIAIGIGVMLLMSASRGRRHAAHGGAILGAAAGLLIGVSDVAIKALVSTVPSDPLSLLGPWTFLALAGGIGAFLALARALQIGAPITVIALCSVAANCSAVLGGIVVFGDPLGGDLLEGLLRGIAFAAVIASAALIPAPRSRTAEAG